MTAAPNTSSASLCGQEMGHGKKGNVRRARRPGAVEVGARHTAQASRPAASGTPNEQTLVLQRTHTSKQPRPSESSFLRRFLGSADIAIEQNAALPLLASSQSNAAQVRRTLA
jgi:hypothetical protein